MAETSFEVRYDGEALRDGRMPVRELAPALLALSQLFGDASRLLYPDNEPVALEIEATREGSFVVDLVLHAVGSGWDQISQMDVGEDTTALVLFKEFVIGDSIDFSLFGLIQWLKGKVVVEEADGPEPDETTLTDRAAAKSSSNRMSPASRRTRTSAGSSATWSSPSDGRASTRSRSTRVEDFCAPRKGRRPLVRGAAASRRPRASL
jgi:hypothetical protein